MEEELNLCEADKLLVEADMMLLPDPSGVLELGVFQHKPLTSTTAVIIRQSKTLEDSEGTYHTCDVPYACKTVLWVEAVTEARSGVCIGYSDLMKAEGDNGRLLVAVPPYKKKVNFKTAIEALTYVRLKDVKELNKIIPAHGKKDLPAFLKSVSTSIFVAHHSLVCCTWCSCQFSSKCSSLRKSRGTIGETNHWGVG